MSRQLPRNNSRPQIDPDAEPDYKRKLVVVGDGGCGKTSLLTVYCNGDYPEHYVPTIFENYIHTTYNANLKKIIQLALWDTAGQEEYDRLRPLSYPETNVVLICFSVDSHASLDNVVDKWYPEIAHFLPNIPVVLVGLKADLRADKSKARYLVDSDKIRHYASQSLGGAPYLECSSKLYQGVEEIFEVASRLTVQGDSIGKIFKRKKSQRFDKAREEGGEAKAERRNISRKQSIGETMRVSSNTSNSGRTKRMGGSSSGSKSGNYQDVYKQSTQTMPSNNDDRNPQMNNHMIYSTTTDVDTYRNQIEERRQKKRKKNCVIL